MELALKQAEYASEWGEIPVGALIAKMDGTVIGLGRNRNLELSDPSAHAEMEAIRQAGQYLTSNRLNGCVLVATLEPCLMCAGAIREARLDGVVFGAEDFRSGALVSCLPGFDLDLISPKPWHYGGVLARRCAVLLSDFFADLR